MWKGPQHGFKCNCRPFLTLITAWLHAIQRQAFWFFLFVSPSQGHFCHPCGPRWSSSEPVLSGKRGMGGRRTPLPLRAWLRICPHPLHLCPINCNVVIGYCLKNRLSLFGASKCQLDIKDSINLAQKFASHTCRPDLGHCLVWRDLHTESSFYILKWLKKSKEKYFVMWKLCKIQKI